MKALELMQTAGFSVDGIIHIGANDGQERYDYAASGASPCIYVEPIDSVFAALKSHIAEFPGHIPVQAVCADREGQTVTFNISSNKGLSSSFLPLGAHAAFHPDVVYTDTQKMTTTTVDALIKRLDLPSVPNLMVIDTQGTELNVLMGATETLQGVDAIFSEVSESPLYENGCTLGEITSFLKLFDFQFRWVELNINGHGDAFYCRSQKRWASLPVFDVNLAFGKTATQSSVSLWSKPGDAQGALNGTHNGSYGFHTESEPNPWWEVDLTERRPIREIRIFNRMDACRERSRTLRVLVSDDHRTWRLIHDQRGNIFGGISSCPLRVIPAGISARYVRLQLAANEALHLDEVEIY
jgi:FkbM family methyltransferase